MEYIKRDKEIDIKELFCMVCLKWRRIIGLCILIMLIVLAINTPQALKYMPILGIGVVIKAILKQMLIFGILCGILSVGYYIVVYSFDGRIKSVKDFVLTTNIPVIGVIPKDIKKKSSIIDSFVKKINDIKIKREQREELFEHVAKAVEADVAARSIADDVKIAIVSSCSDVEALELLENLESKVCDKIQLAMAGDVMVSADGVSKVQNAHYIVLVERQGKSKYTEIESTCKKMNAWNKVILGAIILDVDSI